MHLTASGASLSVGHRTVRPAHGRSPAPSATHGPAAPSDATPFRTVLRSLQAAQRRQGEPPAGEDIAGPPSWELSSFSDPPRGPAGLRWAAEQLEARLWAQLLQEALKPGQDGGLFGPGFSGRVYGEWFSQAVATLVVKSGAGQLARLLVEQFAGAVKGNHSPERNTGGARGDGPARVGA